MAMIPIVILADNVQAMWDIILIASWALVPSPSMASRGIGKVQTGLLFRAPQGLKYFIKLLYN